MGKLYQWGRLMIAAAILLIVTSNAYAGCPGRQPGDLMAILKTTIETGASPTATDMQFWRTCLDADFSDWTQGGSQNLPVIAAAIGMFDKITNSIDSDDVYKQYMPNSNKTYLQWWTEFLNAQTGFIEQPNPNQIRYFHSKEPFSHTYDGSVVAAVACMHYWGRKYASKTTGAANIGDRARQYLKATWVVYGFAAGRSYADRYEMGTKLDANNQPAGPERTYNPLAPLRDDGSQRFNGRFIALAGARSKHAHWAADDKGPLFARATEQIVSRMNENQLQRDLLNAVQPKWTALQLQENLYGLTSDDRTRINTLVQDGSNAATFLPWISTIRTATTFRILGWADGYRASVMEANVNGNDPCMFAITYRADTKDATFLHTWTDANGSTTDSWAKLEPGRIVAWHADKYTNGRLTHPEMKAFIPIYPTSTPTFHLVLSQNGPPFLDGTPQWNYPPGPPPKPDWPPNF